VSSLPGKAGDPHAETKALRLTVALYALQFALKLGVWLVTGVMALLAEALHTLSDVFVAAFLLAALVISRKESDDEHPYGHGRAQWVGALVAATLFISFTSFELLREAIPALVAHHEAEHKNLGLAIAVLVVSMGIAAVPLFVLLARKKRGATAKAQLMELVNDQLGLLAALVATIFVAYGFPIADPLAALFVALIIAVNGAGLFRENASSLLGESPGPEVMASFEAAARAVAGVNAIHGLRAERIGPEHVHGEIHVEVDEALPVKEGHAIAFRVRKAIREAVPGADCVVHVDTGPPPKGEPELVEAGDRVADAR
jgi:ferrous-iron efflux pump FieF